MFRYWAQALADGAPWDAVLVTVRCDRVAPAWVEQLAPGGRLVVPLALGGVRHGQVSIAFEATGDHLRGLSVRDCGFVRPRGAMALADRELALGDRPGLLWGDAGHHAGSVESVFGMLEDRGACYPIGFEVDRRALLRDFQIWLVARDPDTCSVRAEGAWAEWSTIVPLVEVPGRFRGTGGLFDGAGMALLGRRRTADGGEWVVSLHGRGDDAAERLLDHLRRWNRAGRPGRDRLRLRLDRPGLRTESAR